MTQAIPARLCLLAQMGPETAFLHACLSVRVLLSSAVASSWPQGLLGKVVRDIFCMLEHFFSGCACVSYFFFLSFLCRCSPCITTSRSYWLTEGLLGYQQSQNPSPSLEAVSEVFKIFVSLLLALYEHDCSFIWGFGWSRSVFSSGELTCPPAQFVKPRLV